MTTKVKILKDVLSFALGALLATLPLIGSAQDDEAIVEKMAKEIELLQEQIEELSRNVNKPRGPRMPIDADLAEEVQLLREDVDYLEKALTPAEKHAALDNIDFSGEFRFQAHNISTTIQAHFNGMGIQRDMINTMFYMNGNGSPPMTPDPEDYINAVNAYVAQNYSDYQYFINQLTFADLKQSVGMMPPAQQQMLFGMLMPNNFVPAYEHNNSLLYTSRLRLNMRANVGSNVAFDGRLGMYKVWGDSTGVQVFNGQPTSISWDGTTVGVPNSDVLRVERAYFTWTDIGGKPFYLSIGRRPSTGGAPLNLREDELRGGTPLGSLINYQFDGITLGWKILDESTLRFCYGVGYESQWGNGSELVTEESHLDDAWFWGFNWDVWNSDSLFVQATIAQAVDVTDGFNALASLPVDPLTGQELPPAVMRFTPSENLGDINLASIVAMFKAGSFDYFASVNYSSTDPNNVTTPFGGLLSDPFAVPEEQSGSMYYLGARYTFSNDKTKLGLEYNHGSEYWFNFAMAEDDLLGPKTSARGDVWEVYLTHRIRDNFVFKYGYIDYQYDYSGSGWLLGAPQDLTSTPILGFPTYDNASKHMLSLSARF